MNTLLRLPANLHIVFLSGLALGAQVPEISFHMHDSLREAANASNAYFIETAGSTCVLPAQEIIRPDECDEAAEILGLTLGYRGDLNLGGQCAKWPVLGMDHWYYHYASGQFGAQPICKLPAFAYGDEVYCEPGESGPVCPSSYSAITDPAECDEAARYLHLTLGPSGDWNYGGECSQWHAGTGQDNLHYHYASHQCGAIPICALQTYILSSEPCPSGFEAITVAAVCDTAGVALGLSPGHVTNYAFGGNCAKYELGGQVNVYYHWASNQPNATSICAAVATTFAVPTPSPTMVRTDSCIQLATGSVSNDWGTICHDVPTTAGHIQVTMGNVIDFFRPAPGASFCEMLTSSNRHEWSNDLTTWHTPAYYPNHYGGSAANWPLDNVEGDNRRFLSFWGDGVGGVGGCCHNAYRNDAAYPGRPFAMYWCVPRANYAPGPEVSSTGVVTAVGDPHLKNIFGEQFDLMKPGRHVLINIPRGQRVQPYLRVEADANRLGEQCADLYFQELNISGSLAEEKKTGGYHYQARGDHETQEWIRFGKIELKVAHGKTQDRMQYLNIYVKHLKRAGLAVGGLLGEDDHSQVELPQEACTQHITL